MLASVVRSAARRYGERPAFVMVGGPHLTFAELDRRSDQLAVALNRMNRIGEGDIVALRLRSDLGYVVAHVALAKLGAAAAGINPGLAEVEQQRMIQRLDPALVVTDDVLAEGATAAKTGEQPSELPPDPERIAAIVFTSGTSGLPKGAVFRERHLDAIARLDVGTPLDLTGSRDPSPPAAQLASTQFAHVGFMTKLAWYLDAGLTTHVLARWRADDVLDVIASARIGVLGAIAPQIALLLRSPRRPELDLSCLRTLIVGGAPSPPALVRDAIHELGVTYSIRYSSTESGGAGLRHDITAAMLDDPDAGLDTIGRPRPGVEALLDDGELCLRSPAIFDGYWNDGDATAATLVDGWLRTGDLAEMDGAGRIRLVGRRSDMYIRGGYNVAPAEVEAVLGTHPSVAQVVVVPRADAVMGEIGVAVVVVRNGASPPSLEDLRHHAGAGLARWKLPEAMEIVEEIPLTAVSKPDRAELRTFVAGQADAPGC